MNPRDGKVIPFPRFNMRPPVVFGDLQNRLGRFAIGQQSILGAPDVVLLIMAQVIVLQAGECGQGHVCYVALSRHFQPIDVNAGEQPPSYEWRFEGGEMRPYRLTG